MKDGTEAEPVCREGKGVEETSVKRGMAGEEGNKSAKRNGEW